MKTYMIIRCYADCEREGDTEILKQGVSLEEAQAHCKDPETSSRTCSTLEGMERTRKHGAWFDAYEEERK